MKKQYINSTVSKGSVLIAALMLGNVLNFLFNAVLGRALSLEQFSILTLANTFWFLISIFLTSLASTANNRTAYLGARRGAGVASGFRNFFMKKILFPALGVSIAWVLITPLLSVIFHTQNYLLFLSISPVISLGIFTAVNRGYFQGRFSFVKVGVIIIVEALSKLIAALLFINLNLKPYVYLSIPISIVCTFLVVLIFLAFVRHEKKEPYHYIFPRKLLFATFLTVFSSTAFLSVDLLLARHFLSPSESGAYSLLSLVGKMVYFLGSLLNVFILTFASRDLGLNKKSTGSFYKIMILNIAMLVVACTGLGLFGGSVVPVLFGQKSLVILPYLTQYTLGIAMFTIASAIATYHLAKHQYIFAYNGIFITIFAVIGMVIWHGYIGSFVDVIILSSFVYLALNVVFHVLYKDVFKYIDEEDTRKIGELSVLKRAPVLSVAIGVPAYNEENNIGNLLKALLKQKTNLIFINKIIVISSGSTDKTDEIVRKIAKSDKRITFIPENKRNGKSSAINTFLKHVKDPVVVIQSADTIPMEDTIEKLCRPFLIDNTIGMTGGAPIPVNDENTFLGYIIHAWWWFHRNIPRFGEIIAFRNIIEKLPVKVLVDEAYVQAKMVQKGLKVVYIDEAVVFNKGAETVADLVKQRRKLFLGHANLSDKEHVRISYLSKSGLRLLLFKYKIHGPRELLWFTGGFVIEAYVRLLGLYDRYIIRNNPYIWDMASSTKNLNIGRKGGAIKK